MHYGLIGKKLGHSFSEQFFTQKFAEEGLDHQYRLYELASLDELKSLLASDPELWGLNVTIPYKIEILEHALYWDIPVIRAQAANLLVILPDGDMAAFNTDVKGFTVSLEDWMQKLGRSLPATALIAGSGGASRAVQEVCRKLGIACRVVARQAGDDLAGEPYLLYEELPGRMGEFELIVNTTPLGTWPEVDQAPPLPYEELTAKHLAHDLVYNPEVTLFMERCQAQGAAVKNGMEMLIAQAEEGWRIWKKYSL